MKKLLFIFTMIMSLTLLIGCSSDKYPPIESTKEEAETVITLKIEDKEYGVPYELYRALFLNNKSRVDGGNAEAWSGDGASAYIDKINSFIINDAVEIFSVLHLASTIGFDPFSDKTDLKVKEMFESDIESYGAYNKIEGDDKKYEAFLENLKENNLNYGAADLLYRYALAENAIDSYYRTDYKYSKEDVKGFYNSDNCARILQSYFQAGVKTYAAVEKYHGELLEINDEMALAIKIIGSTAATETDLIDNGKISGIVVGRYSLSQRKYSNYINEIFETSDGELSDIITLGGTNADGYYIAYRLEKSDEHFETFYPAIANSYLDNIVGGILGGMENELDESRVFTDAYYAISHKDISIN